jgi:hypothetical protein
MKNIHIALYPLCRLMLFKYLNQPKKRSFDLRITQILFLGQTKLSISPHNSLIDKKVQGM